MGGAGLRYRFALDPNLVRELRTDVLSFIVQGIPGRHRYTRLLANADLSKVIYAYGTMDRATGGLDQAEVDFPNARGAEVIAVEPIPGSNPNEPDLNGGHGSMFTGHVPRQIVDLIEN